MAFPGDQPTSRRLRVPLPGLILLVAAPDVFVAFAAALPALLT